MGLPELKHKIQLQIENADERVLRIVSSVFDNYYTEIETSEEKIKELLKISEKEYEEGKTESYDSILRETKEKYFRK
jgi:hypothetical protein